MTYDELVTLFAYRLRAFEARDVEALVANFSDTSVLESPASGRSVGRAAIERTYRNLFAAIPDVGMTFEDLIVMGDQVVQTGTVTGTETGGFLGQSPTTEPFSVPVVLLFVIEGHTIVRERRVYDFSGLLQGVFATEVRFGGTPAETVGHVNAAMLRRAIDARFATALYARVTADGVLTYCNAGHNPPILIGAERLLRLTAGGPVVGILEKAVYQEETVRLDQGDILIVHSDGITEALSPAGEEFGDERLVSCVQSHRASSPGILRDAVLEAVRRFTAGALQNDDLSVLVLRYSGIPPADGSRI